MDDLAPIWEVKSSSDLWSKGLLAVKLGKYHLERDAPREATGPFGRAQKEVVKNTKKSPSIGVWRAIKRETGLDHQVHRVDYICQVCWRMYPVPTLY